MNQVDTAGWSVPVRVKEEGVMTKENLGFHTLEGPLLLLAFPIYTDKEILISVGST